jgi:hypothetical protein
MAAVSKEDVARLHSYLVVPIAVNEAMMSTMPIEGDIQYGLHVALSEIEPDSALLAIALSAQRIAMDFKDMPIGLALKIEADKIVDDYAGEWLANFNKHPIQGEDLFDLLCNIPEDLESIADLLESVQSALGDDDLPAATLCSILAIQARAQMEIADYVLTELENEASGIESTFDGICRAPVQHAVYENNIILFPAHRRRH